MPPSGTLPRCLQTFFFPLSEGRIQMKFIFSIITNHNRERGPKWCSRSCAFTFFPSIYLHDKSIIRRKSNETTYIYRILEKKKQSKKNIKSECVYSSSVNMEYGTVCVHCGHQLPEWQTRGMEKNAIYQMKIARCPGDRCFFCHPQLHTHLLTANELKTNQRM